MGTACPADLSSVSSQRGWRSEHGPAVVGKQQAPKGIEHAEQKARKHRPRARPNAPPHMHMVEEQRKTQRQPRSTDSSWRRRAKRSYPHSPRYPPRSTWRWPRPALRRGKRAGCERVAACPLSCLLVVGEPEQVEVDFKQLAVLFGHGVQNEAAYQQKQRKGHHHAADDQRGKARYQPRAENSASTGMNRISPAAPKSAANSPKKERGRYSLYSLAMVRSTRMPSE